ncbi:MAG: hypothetical protein D0433_14565 [Candidatus Thermochlorobacter aerophilum]|uniref:Uncharacterized protein n=1 Tax=Candidatus Thermochlorobacter aerophilus TaxID=1868324 RepID=A0A395LVL6_9BACT|nr:MAG: hypothetical protein D0433_14565 [Candidatus Thermochlorobacter aerophilum]
MLRFAQHDNVGMWMLHCACASFSMTGNVMPSTFVMAGIVSLRAFLLRHSERSEESTVWMLRFAQHDNVGMWMLHCACASFSMTGVRIANLRLLSLSLQKERNGFGNAETG